MIKRRSAQFDLPASSRFFVNRQHELQKLELFRFQDTLIRFGEIFSARRKPIHIGIARNPLFFHPCELREQLQVPPIAWREGDDCLRAACRPRPFEQLAEPWPSGRKSLVIYLKGAREDLAFILASELLRILERQIKPRLMERAARILFQLQTERRHHVERRVKPREFFKNLDHAPVILERVQSRPWQNVAASLGIAILRLVHVPQNNQMNLIHRAHRAGWCARGMLHFAFLSCASWIATSSARFFVMRSLASLSSRLFSSFLNLCA